MPENESNIETIGNTEKTEPMTETRLEKFEREQMSRRAALRKIGYTSAMATLAMFGADDVMRLVGRKMEQRARDSQVAEVVARELSGAGVAMALNVNPCQNCVTAKTNCLIVALTNEKNCLADGFPKAVCSSGYTGYVDGCENSYVDCCALNGCHCF